MKKLIFGMIMTAAVLFAASGSKSYALGDTRIIGQIESSKVDVELKKTEENPGNISVFPGDALGGSVKVINQGDDCYVRMKLYASDAKNNIYGIKELRVNISKDWALKEKDTFYYKNILRSGDEVEFCSGMAIPNDGVYKDLNISYELNAIQSANMTVDFDNLHPWGSVEAYSFEGKETRTLGYKMAAYKLSGENDQNLTLEYNDEVRDIIKNFDEIFTSMPSMKPGDSFQESIELCNLSEKTKMLYMKDTTDHSEILKHVNVDIVSVIDGEEKNIYSGTLADSESEEMVLVGTLKPKAKGELVVKAYMSEDAGNEAAGLSGHISLSMEAVNLGEKPSGNQNLSSGNNPGDNNNSGTGNGSGSDNNSGTGNGSGSDNNSGTPTVVVTPHNSSVIPTVAEINKDVPEGIITNDNDVETNINKIDYNNSPTLENPDSSGVSGGNKSGGEMTSAEASSIDGDKDSSGKDGLLTRTVKTGDERHTYTYFMIAAILLTVAGVICPKKPEKIKDKRGNTGR